MKITIWNKNIRNKTTTDDEVNDHTMIAPFARNNTYL